ncbi:MAG TPA: hypothetical protein VIH59_22995 [Candidatus Tectomicrobia bacterium]|jgi:hypothetical protein
MAGVHRMASLCPITLHFRAPGPVPRLFPGRPRLTVTMNHTLLLQVVMEWRTGQKKPAE